MYSLGLLAVSSFVLALLLTPVVRNLARRFGWVDHPGESRRIHTTAIPRVGGVAILVAYAGAFGVLFTVGFSALKLVRPGLPIVERLIPAVALMFAVGLLDDLRGLKPWQKFAGQIAAAFAAIWAGVLITGIAGIQFPHWAAVPVTVLWIVGCSNAVNLIDGIDGLATGIGLFATATIFLAALLSGNIALALATAPLAGALLGFLRYNFNPATIFLGDCGSLTVGFLLGCFGALWSQKSATVLGMTAPLMALAIPLLDTALSIVRRFLRMQPVWGADRGHIHHRLLDQGLTPRRAALVLYAAAGVGAILSVFQSATDASYGGIVIVIFCAAAWMGVQHLGYVEFGVAGRMFVDGAFRRHLGAQISLRSFEECLAQAATPEECWGAIARAGRDFGCAPVHMRLAGRSFGNGNGNGHEPGALEIHIPLPENGCVDLVHDASNGARPDGVGAFADCIWRNLGTRAEEFRSNGGSKPRAMAARA